jgi:hypothetical protein
MRWSINLGDFLTKLEAATTFSTGIFIEYTFNRISTLTFQRPYDSPVFVVVQDRDIPALMALLESGNASVYDVDLLTWLERGYEVFLVGARICFAAQTYYGYSSAPLNSGSDNISFSTVSLLHDCTISEAERY